jgi:hypothetical protein
MPTAYDYSAGPIAPAALAAAGVRTVMRYVSTPGQSKNITPAEYRQLVEAGIAVGLVYETSAGWMLGGYSAGAAAARSARAQAVAVGYPSWYPIWYAADFQATAAQIATVLDTLHGAADAEGSKALVGAYGDFEVCTAAAAAGFAAPWQTAAWSGADRCPAAALYQTGTQTVCGGVQVDINELTGTLFPAPTNAAPAAQEDEMANPTITCDATGRAGLQWAGGTHGIIQVGYDPGAGNPTLRVVLTMPTGPWVAPAWKPAAGSGDYEIPANLRADCRGVVVTLAAGSPHVVYDLCAV